jgi:hypothetical protein
MEITKQYARNFRKFRTKISSHQSKNRNPFRRTLLWAKPITYWDYIQTDALLNLHNFKEPLYLTKWYLLCTIKSMNYCSK